MMRQTGVLVGGLALTAADALTRAMDRPRSLGKLSIQSHESKERAYAAAEAKRQRRAEKRAAIIARGEAGDA
jgi:hypothetical protein